MLRLWIYTALVCLLQNKFKCVATNELIPRRLNIKKVNNKCLYKSGYILGSIEDETVKALKDLYPEKFKDGKIIFVSIDIEKEGNEKLIEDLKVTGQTLLVISGENKIDLTNAAFMYAKTKPEKLKKKIQTTIDEINKLNKR